MLQHLKSVPSSPYYFEKLTLFLLELLKVYDSFGSSNEELLNAIIDLSSWLIENDTTTPINILKLNNYQAIKRQRELNAEEKNSLYRIIEDKPDKEEVYVGAYLLLDNFEAASLHFNAMDKDTQEVFKNYPIYRFCKN